ncbi:MAG: CDP-alcohol phosphatidyltransferase family protein [Thermoleophilia bacterium]|nr:CDP-alcohol phosphatidyltransferase family protein [Thermoleophilia bacterium]
MVRVLVRAGVTPNAVTVFGFLATVATAILVGGHLWIAAGIVFVIGSISDMFDGAVARMSGRTSRFGAFLDSNLDRLGEGLVLGGIGVALAVDGHIWAVGMTFAALAGSFMVSYARARAEGLGITSNRGGVMTRTERLLLVGFGIFFGGWGITLPVVVTILTVGTLITFAQRMIYVHSFLRNADSAPDAANRRGDTTT